MLHSSQAGRSRLELLLIIYLLAIPLLIFCIFVAAFAPFEISANPNRFGPQVLSAMLNSMIGLYFLGTVALVALALALFLLISYLWLPFALVINKLRGVN